MEIETKSSLIELGWYAIGNNLNFSKTSENIPRCSIWSTCRTQNIEKKLAKNVMVRIFPVNWCTGHNKSAFLWKFICLAYRIAWHYIFTKAILGSAKFPSFRLSVGNFNYCLKFFHSSNSSDWYLSLTTLLGFI